ncbi:pancreatic triacylglycerol lipase-like [Episyrphus balteatus]|uniref:pancreatic triacylglycerol lipase-like n=1 Tax=Episyrphus balteatus TaxID=286459 RepID=UPI0024859634|nr:pancreatic triacylglycerol lipase-like [Episyrphus balteatus]
MKLNITFLIAAALLSEISAKPLRNTSEVDGWFVPTVDGKFFWMTREQFENEYDKPNERKTVSVEYYLYTQTNPTSPEELYLDDTDTLASSSFDKNKPTRFIIHGWQNNANSDVNLKIREALMEVGSFNVISVDWSSAAGSLNYASSKSAVSTVGKNVAAFIDFLNEKAGMTFESLTLVGHSLGAHVSGYAGKNVNRGKINIITGLDPAAPLFDYSNCDTRLCSTDAMFVDSIQTNGKLLGFLEPIGKAAYYPNGGKSQPGCLLDLAGSCSHSRSFKYYAEALLENNFLAIKCSDYEAAVAKDCKESYQGLSRMGSPGSIFNEGAYYVPVNKKSLFGTG